MQKRDSSILQRVKDNAFYVALGLGLVAILAVVAVYTMGQSGGKLAKDDSDVKSASEYVQVQDSDEGNVVGATGSVEREIVKDDNNVTTDNFMCAPVDLENTMDEA